MLIKRHLKILSKKNVINFIKNNFSFGVMFKSIVPKYNEQDITIYQTDDTANIFFMGRISNHCSLKKFNITTKYLIPILKQNDLGFIYSNVSLKKELSDELIKNNIEVVTPGYFKTFEFDELKVGVISFNVDDYAIYKSDITRIVNETNYVICYLSGNVKDKKIIKELNNIGVRYIFTFNFVIRKKVYKILGDKSSTYVIRGMNNISTHSLNILKRDGFFIKLGIAKDSSYRFIEKSYVPYFIAPFYKGHSNVILPIPMVKNDLGMTAIIASRRRISAIIGNNILENNRLITFQRLCDLINVEFPIKYNYLKNANVAGTCLYPFEVKNNSVLFLRPYDKVIHNCTKKEYYDVKLLKLNQVRKTKKLLFVFSPIKLSSKIPHIVVKDPLELHRKICVFIRNLYDINFAVAVTGSVGKTTCKEMIASVLNEKYVTYQNKQNGNLQRQIGRTISSIRSYYEVYAQEVGGGKINGASNSSQLILPNAAVVTNVGHSHLRWSGTREQLLKNKVGIKDGLVDGGLLYYNLDNDMLSDYKTSSNSVTFAINNPDADYYATDIKQYENGLVFILNNKNKRVKIKLNIIGEHNVYNALVAYAIGRQAGVSIHKIKKGLSRYHTKGIRQNTIRVAGMTLYVDCYNAAPESVNGAIKTISNLNVSNGRRIAVLADITGMADLTKTVHVNLAKYLLEQKIDILFGIGDEIKKTCSLLKNSRIETKYFSNPLRAAKSLASTMKNGDIILFKGSSLFSMEETVIDNVFGTSLVEVRDYDATKYSTDFNKNYKFCTFSNHDSILKYRGQQDKIVVPSKIKKNIMRINDNAFLNCNAKEISLCNSITNIGVKAFFNCKNLNRIKLPSNLKIIYDEAFSNCVSLKEILLPKKTIHIGSKAFSGCNSLEQIYVPNSVRYIAPDAFRNCNKLIFNCSKDSYAYIYAKDKGIKIIVNNE